MTENREICKRIAEDIDAYAEGRVYRCPECGETITTPEEWSREKYKCPCCKTVLEERDMEPLSMWDYFDDVFDIEYTVGSRKEYRGVRVMVACGGPNIYINTMTKNVELYWWTDSAHYPLSYDAVEAIDEYFCEVFECL